MSAQSAKIRFSLLATVILSVVVALFGLLGNNAPLAVSGAALGTFWFFTFKRRSIPEMPKGSA